MLFLPRRHYYSSDKEGCKKVRGNEENSKNSITVWLLKRAVSFAVLVNLLELVTSRTQNIERTVVQDIY